MSHFCTHRIPRAHLDPIDSELDALAVVSIALTQPLSNEIIAVLLDAERRGHGIVVVDDPPDEDGIFAVVDMFTTLATDPRGADDLRGVVLASCRPGGGLDVDDGRRWLEASELCDAAGVELVEWFVIGKHLACPRELVGEAPRWAN